MKKREIDLSTNEKKKEFFDILDGFKCKREAYEYLCVYDNSYGISYLKELANMVGFDLNIYAKRNSIENKICLWCGKEFSPKRGVQKFCSSSCAASYNNTKRDKENKDYKIKLSKSLKKYYKEHPKEIKGDFRWIDGKKTRIKTKKCSICGGIDCEKKGICKHTKKFFENLTYFGFDVNCLGTNKVFEEYERISKFYGHLYKENQLDYCKQLSVIITEFHNHIIENFSTFVIEKK